MLYSIVLRTLKEGVTLEEFRDAWLPDAVEAGTSYRVVNARNVKNPREIVSIGMIDLAADQIDRFAALTAQHNQRRHERIQPLIEGERQFLGVFEVIGDDELAP